MKLNTAGGRQANNIKAPRSNPCNGMSQRLVLPYFRFDVFFQKLFLQLLFAHLFSFPTFNELSYLYFDLNLQSIQVILQILLEKQTCTNERPK